MASADSQYHAWHRRLDVLRLPAKYHACAWCFRTANQWAYRWNDENERNEDGRVWSEDSRNYVAMCRSCHRTMDQAYRRVGREGLAKEIAPLIKAAYAAVSPERRAVEARAREASANAAHAFLDARDAKLGNRFGRRSVSDERATHELLVKAYAVDN
ncbi:hypothetical protein [Streptomyces sp. WAC 06783]|uniref:hypothetical protein n=1 Tax=Streptomyces sp. WAC 06783 TaxID=2203211 RepID=UPI000F745A35|nr:hypothetical protein [Streptomyces sp. WAC 06783]